MLLQDMQAIADREPVTKLWPAYDEGYIERGTYLSSSETGTCLRKAYYDRHDKPGFEPNGFAERGHVIEDWLVRKILPLRNLGYKIEYVGEDQRTFYIDDLGISGTPDGLITIPKNGEDGEPVVIEIKSIDPRTNKSNLPKRNHVMQAQQNMLLMSRCLNLNIKRAMLLYIDASNLFDQVEFEIPWDEAMQEELLQRARDLDYATNAAALEAEGMMNDGCTYCTHGAPCSALVTARLAVAKKAGGSFFDDESPSGLTKVFNPSPEETIALQRYIASRELSEQGKDGMAEHDEEIRQMIADNGGSIYWAGATLTLGVQAGIVTLDKDKVSALAEKNQMKLADLQKQGSPFTKLSVKL